MAKATKKRKAQSVTLSQLRRELKQYPTKKDLKDALKGYATQRDLELWGGQLQHQMQELRVEMQNMEHRLIENIPIQLGKMLDERIAAYTEHKAADLLGVTGDEVKLIQDKQADHEARLTKVEKTIGVR